MITIRRESPQEIKAIHDLNRAAFESFEEADLVDKLRASNALTLSLVAVKDNEVVGHIAFSPVTIDSDREVTVSSVGLAPMAVLPKYQRTGIGSLLIKE